MNLEKYKYIFFVGIGGIGMSALARYFIDIGKVVLGYDKTPTPLTEKLEKEGVNIFFDETTPRGKFPISETLVIYTPAIPDNQSDILYFKKYNYKMLKRSEVLGQITKDKYTLAVAGTHGKTTVAAILTHLLKTADIPIISFVGGILNNYNTNYINNGNKIAVVEADEFDRSFLKLNPDIACITSMDEDHLDIYQDKSNIQDAFKEFANKVDKSKLFIKKGLPLEGNTFGIEDNSKFCIINKKLNNNEFTFDIINNKKTFKDLKFKDAAIHNLLNALIAFSMALQIEGVSEEKLRQGLATFSGVSRRFIYEIQTEYFVYIDDYAHHPTEIKAIYNAVRYAHPDKKIMAIFQPHLYTRTRDFSDDFARSLEKFDTIGLLDIYPAREIPLEGITSDWLLSKINNSNKFLIPKSEIITMVQKYNPDIFITMGAGDIGLEVPKLKKKLLAKIKKT